MMRAWILLFSLFLLIQVTIQGYDEEEGLSPDDTSVVITSRNPCKV